MGWFGGDDAPAPVRREPSFAKSGSQGAPSGAVTQGSFAFPNPNLWGMFGGWSGSTGTPVTPLSAMQASAVYACVKALSEDVGKLRVRLKRRNSKGAYVVDSDHSFNRVLRQPNAWQIPFDFWAYLVTSFCLRGNAFAAGERGQAGQLIGLIPLNPDRVSVMISPRGWLYYNTSHPQIGDGVMVHQDNMVHTRNISLDGGYLGLSPIALSQDVVGIVIAAQQHGATLFRQGAQVGGVLSSPGKLSNEASKRMSQSWQDAYSGVQNAHKVAVLEEGVKFEKIAMTAEDAQLLESRRFGVVEICRLFRVPPHKAFELSDAHYSNMGQSTIEYIDDAIEPICARLRQNVARVAFFEDEKDCYELEFDYSVLLRGDRKTRFDIYSIALQNGLMSQNEARAEEGLSNIGPEGDTYRHPLNTGADGQPVPASPGRPASNPVPASGQPAEPEPAPDTAPVENVIPQ